MVASFLAEWKAKPLVVQRLSFVWCLLAFYPLAVLLSVGLCFRQWDAGLTVGSLVIFALLLALAWGHFRGHDAARKIGLALSVFGMLFSPFALWNIFLVMQFLSRYHHRYLPSQAVARRAHLVSYEDYQSVAVVDTCIVITGWILVVAVLVLVLAPSGRAAYSIGRPQKL